MRPVKISGSHAFACLCAAFIALRLAFAGGMNLLHEESYYWLYAQHLAPGYLDHPPMIAWLIWSGTRLLGHNEMGVRLGGLLCSGAAAGFIAALARMLFDRAAARAAFLLMLALPFSFTTGFLALPDAPLTAAWAACLYYLARVYLRGDARAWFGAGLALGIGLLSKYSIGLVPIAAALYMIVEPTARHWWRRPGPYLAAVIALLVFSPVIYWNATHEWASFAFQTVTRAEGRTRFSLHLLLLSGLLLLTPAGVWAAVRILAGRDSVSPPSAPGARPLLRWLQIFTLVPLGVFALFSLTRAIKLNWTGPVWLAVIPALGAALADAHRRARPAALRGWTATFATLSAAYAVIFFVVAVPLIPALSARLIGMPFIWDNIGDRIDRIEDRIERQTGKPLLVTGTDMNKTSSQLAFYDPGIVETEEVTGRHLWKRESLMFEQWSPESRAVGRDVIIVALGDEREELDKVKIAKRFKSLGPIIEERIAGGDGPGEIFYYRIGHDFTPFVEPAGTRAADGPEK